MSVQPIRLAAPALIVLLLQACGGGVQGPPDVPSAYKDRLEEAWDLAGRGHSPTGACTRVVGVAVGRSTADASARPEAIRAYEACYVDVNARYLEAVMQQAADAGDPDPCGRMASHVLIERMSLGSFAADLGLARADLDARLAARIGDQVRTHCPSQADTILGG